MRYQRLIWNGFEEAQAMAEKWRLSKDQLLELISLVKSAYNSGANDLQEYLKEAEINNQFSNILPFKRKRVAEATQN